MTTFTGHSLISGTAAGTLLHATVPLSFWGGVDPLTGIVIDQHHPLNGQTLAGKILAIPSGRGSSTGSSVLLELLVNGHAPAALVFVEKEEILTLGAVVAEELFEKSLPIIQLTEADFYCLQTDCTAALNNQYLSLVNDKKNGVPAFDAMLMESVDTTVVKVQATTLSLNSSDVATLNGDRGKAAQVAMQIVTRMASIQGADSLIDIKQAHIDACVYNGPSSLLFAQQLVDWGGQVCVPTTLNAISVDQQRWQQQGIEAAVGQPASDLGDAYLAMGAKLSFTCAPYLLDSAPSMGEQIVWAESNAVVYANSVLGARTQKYADFMDVCIALTGRAPKVGSHMDSGRLPNLVLTVEPPKTVNDAYWPLLGYHLGLIAGFELPIVYGLENSAPTTDNLKAFSAAFATTSSTAMIHIAGVTPEADIAHRHLLAPTPDFPSRHIKASELLTTFQQLNTAHDTKVNMICLGNPHFSLSECCQLANLCEGNHKHAEVAVLVTMGRSIHERAIKAGYVKTLEAFGVQFITDTCWCMITHPVIPDRASVLMTNSGKYAHYAPGLVGKSIYFDSLKNCVKAAISGQHHSQVPDWLADTE